MRSRARAVSAGVVASASWRNTPRRSAWSASSRVRTATTLPVTSSELCVRERTRASRESRASAVWSLADGTRRSNDAEPREPLLSTDELTT